MGEGCPSFTGISEGIYQGRNFVYGLPGGYDRFRHGIKSQGQQVIHALGVHPDFTGKGVGRSMVEEAVRIAAGSGARAVRLDVLDTNEPAKKLYCRCGFEYRGTAKLYYENTGWRNFDMYELCMN